MRRFREIGGAAAAGTWMLGDLTVSRIGFGAMRLPQRGRAFEPGAIPGDRDQAITVLRAAVELGVNHIDRPASTSPRCARPTS